MNYLKFTFLLIIPFLLWGCPSSTVKSDSDFQLKTFEDSVSYALGMNTSMQFSYYNEADFRPDMIEKAINDLGSGRASRMSKEQKKLIMQTYFVWARGYQEDSLLSLSESFLLKNAERSGVNQTERGLQYEVVRKGDENGSSPDGNDVVKAFYKQGTPMKGILWDSKDQKELNDTTLISLNNMYSGVSEAFQLMKPGDVFHIWVNPEIGSLEKDDILKVIGKNEVLYAEIELFEVIPRKTSEISEGERNGSPGFFIDESRRND